MSTKKQLTERQKRLLKSTDARAFGAEITRRYLAKGWTRQRFLRWTQLHATQLAQYEAGLCKPRITTAHWIATCLDTTLDDLLRAAKCARITKTSHFGTQLRIARKAMGLTLRELSDLLRVPYYYVQRWEGGYLRASEAQVRQLAKLLQVSVDELIGPPRTGVPRDGTQSSSVLDNTP